MKILFCAHYLNSIIYKDMQRYETLNELGHDVRPFPFHGYTRYGAINRAVFRLGIGRLPERNVSAFNTDMLRAIRDIKPDIIWVEKALLLLPATIDRAREALPKTIWVSFQDDNPFGKRRNEVPTWRNFINSIPSFDVHFVKRDSDLKNFRRCGARRVIQSQTGFYPKFYHAYPATEVPSQMKHDTVFIGTALDTRVRAISQLMTRHGLPIDVYGGLWNRHLIYLRNHSRFHGFAGLAYPLIVSGSRISLGYVSSSNLDEYNGRSVEIPACGGFLLAERTPRHLELYREGEEAEFFASVDECASKIRFYLRNESSRARIAKAGYERCLKSDYSLARSIREAMREVSVIHDGGEATQATS